MLILFFKAAREIDPSKEPPVDKMRRILQSHVDEAKTEDEKQRALRELQKLSG